MTYDDQALGIANLILEWKECRKTHEEYTGNSMLVLLVLLEDMASRQKWSKPTAQDLS